MCRSIKQLRRPAEAPTDAEISAAARQYIRKVSGYRTPSRANSDAFEQAVAEVSRATRQLLEALVTAPGPARAIRSAPSPAAPGRESG